MGATFPTAAVDRRPGFEPARLVRLMTDAIAAMRLDLAGRVVLTEAATGAYVVTPVIAAMAGADRVIAFTRASRHGSVADVAAGTLALARLAGVDQRITVTSERRREYVAAADVVTNSGHVRPIDAELIGWMRATAVVPLMFEAWELMAGRVDVDVDALRARGIAFAGTNERHPDVGVFEYLGLMAVRLLLDAGIPARGSTLAVLCDNPFEEYLVRGLERCGAAVTSAPSLDRLDGDRRPDAVLVSLRPRAGAVVGAAEAAEIARRWPGVAVAQFWGDLDRAALAAEGLSVWPREAPGHGHMAVLPSDVGPDPIVRLQAGGLKVGSVLLTRPDRRSPDDQAFLDEL